MEEVEWTQATGGQEDWDIMMLPTDYTLVSDKAFKKYALEYAKNQDVFFRDFSAAFAKLMELGVPTSQFVASEPWILKNLDEKK